MLRVGDGRHDGAGAKCPRRFQPFGQPCGRNARSKATEIGSVAAMERSGFTAMTVDAPQLFNQVSTALDLRIAVGGIFKRCVEEHRSGQRLEWKLRGLPARLDGGDTGGASISHFESMPTCGQGKGLTADGAAVDRNSGLPRIERVLARPRNR